MPNEKPVPVRSRLTTKDAMFFPSVQGKGWKTTDADVRWEIEDIINHIFPKEHQERSFSYAVLLARLILDHPQGIDKNILSAFIRKNTIPEATLYNVIIPKLVRFGLLERKRETNLSGGEGWFLLLKPSSTFSTHLEKLAAEWRSTYKTAAAKKSDSKQ